MNTSNQDLFAPAPPAPAPNGMVVCEFDDLALAIPQADVLSIEHGGELAAPLQGERVIGWFESTRGPWPVYALDRTFASREQAIAGAFIVFLWHTATPIGLLCDAVRIVGARECEKRQPLPAPLSRYAPPQTSLLSLADARPALCFASGRFVEWMADLDVGGCEPRPIKLHALPESVPDIAPQSARAWLIEWPVQPLALALCEVIEVIDTPAVHRLPFGPPWCNSVLAWRDRFVPLATGGESTAHSHVIVTAFQLAPRAELQYAAFAIRGAPRQITVIDGLDCEPPSASVFDPSQLRASFQFENRAIVVPELAHVFADAA